MSASFESMETYRILKIMKNILFHFKLELINVLDVLGLHRRNDSIILWPFLWGILTYVTTTYTDVMHNILSRFSLAPNLPFRDNVIAMPLRLGM